MRSIYILILFFIELFVQPVCAQNKLSDWFVKSQSPHLEILPQNARLDLLDYYDAGFNAIVENSFKGKTRLIYKDEDKIKLQLTPLSTFELYTFYVDTIDTIMIELLQVEAPIAMFKVQMYFDSKPAQSLNFDSEYFKQEIEKLHISSINKHQLIQEGLFAQFDLQLKRINIYNPTYSQYSIPPLIYDWDNREKTFIKNKNE